MKNKLMIQERAFRTMFLWLIWAAAAIAVHFALYLDPNLWAYIKQDQSKFFWVFFGLFFFGVLLCFCLVFLFFVVVIHASKLGKTAMKFSLAGINPENPASAVERVFLSLKEVIRKNDQPDVEALLDMEMGPYHRTSHAVDIIGNLLITLGLIGTVVGLTMTLAGLTTSLDALGHDQERLLAGLTRAMGGMGTAFYTTLLGSVLGGVLLRVFSMITEHGIEGLSESLKKICMVYCSSDLKPSLERELRIFTIEITALGETAQRLRKAMNDSRLAISSFREEAVRLHQLSEEDGKN